MKRVQVIFQPGMRALIRQRFPGEDLLTATRELISSQLQQLRNWNNHHIVRNWMHLPPRSAQENGSSDPNVTPGIEPGSSIEDVIQGLRDNLDDVTSPLIGITAADEDTRRHSNEVSRILVPALFKYRSGVVNALAKTAHTTPDQILDDFFEARYLLSAVAQDKTDVAINSFPKASAWLKHIGLVHPVRTVPAAIPWQSPTTNGRADKRDIPFNRSDYNLLAHLKTQSAVGKEEICRELLFCGLTNTPSAPHLTSIAEARLMSHHFRLLSRIEHEVIRPYDGLLGEDFEIPADDIKLAPFIESLSEAVHDLHVFCGWAQQMLNGFILARQSSNHSNLVKLIRSARYFYSIKPEMVHFQHCSKLAGFLTLLGINNDLWLSSPKTPSEANKP